MIICNALVGMVATSLFLPHAYAVVGRRLIVGGTEAQLGRYTYAVSLKDHNGSHYCGGSLLSREVVLTAAHCVAFGDTTFNVVIGRHNLTDESAGDDVSVIEIVPHPNYDMRRSEDYDIALVFLSRPTAADVDVVRINANDFIPAAADAVTYLGWGEIDTDPLTLNTSSTLREVETFVISNEQCAAIEGVVDGTGVRESYTGLITPNMICTYSEDRDSCQKDSGGPLIIRGQDASGDVQVGVASWGIQCASSFPGVAARISAVYEWIEDTLCQKSNPSLMGFECYNTTLLEMEVPDGHASSPTTLGGDAFDGDRVHSVATIRRPATVLSAAIFPLLAYFMLHT